MDLLGTGIQVPREAVVTHGGYWQPKYSIPNAKMVEAVQLLARTESILLDPVYTGKAMAGLMDWVRHGRYRSDENIVFIHTGGQAGLFGFCNTLSHSSRKAVNANPLD
jgi:D-cysteine desulfhydrase